VVYDATLDQLWVNVKITTAATADKDGNIYVYNIEDGMRIEDAIGTGTFSNSDGVTFLKKVNLGTNNLRLEHAITVVLADTAVKE
jgi:hypothetical protein